MKLTRIRDILKSNIQIKEPSLLLHYYIQEMSIDEYIRH